MRRKWLVLALLGHLAALAAYSGPEGAVRILSCLEDAPAVKDGVALVVFFSTECASCYEDLFEMRFLVEKNGWPVSVVGIAAGIREDLEVFLEKHAWPLPVVWDRKKTAFRKLGVRNAPSKLVLVAGKVIYRDDPYKDSGRRRAEIAKFLGEIFSPFR